MAMILPEILLFNIVESALKHLADDVQAAQNNSTTSFLYRIFNGIKDEKHDYYKEALDLFGRKKDHPRKIRSRLFFDAQEANIPTIHITMPQEQNAEDHNSIGVGEDPEDTFIDQGAGEHTPNRTRFFNSTFHVIVTSDNHREVMIIYHTIKAVFISALSEINIAGLENPKLSGQDIRPKEDIVPRNVFMRGMGISSSYEVTVPRFFNPTTINEIILNPGTPINPNPSQSGIQGQVTLDDN